MSPKRSRRVDHWDDPDAPKPTSRKASASVVVQHDGRLLLLRRVDNDQWTIPTGGVKKGETVAEAAVRECREETGLDVETVDLVGIFSDPRHLIVYYHRDKVDEVRQPINICLRARIVGGEIDPAPDEAQEVRWVTVEEITDYPIHPAIRLRIDHALQSDKPFIG